MLKLRDLRAASVVAQLGSAGRAAEILSLSQPAVTHAIRRIESHIREPVFERHHRGMVPTALGQVVLNRVNRALENFTLAGQEIARCPVCGPTRPNALETLKRTVSHTHLQVLVRLADSGSVAGTAAALEVTRTVVYRLLRDMEGILGAPIFNRGVTFVCTPLGQVLVRFAKLVLTELRILSEEIELHAGHVSGRVVIGTLPSSRSYLVPAVAARIARRYPRLRLSMRDEPCEKLISELACGNVDLIVGSIEQARKAKKFEHQLLFREPMVILARAGHALTRKPVVTIEDLARESWVLPPAGAPTRGHLENLFLREGLPVPTDIVETDSMAAIRVLIVEDERITIASPNRARFEIQHGLFEILRFPIGDVCFDFGYTIRSQAAVSPGTHEFIRALEELSASEQGMWRGPVPAAAPHAMAPEGSVRTA